MHDVFISYSHKDAQVADAICHNLEEAGIRCWYAPRNIGPGAEWADAIIEALEACSIVVLVFTDFSNASRQVQREVDTAVTLGKTIIPFKRTQTDPTGSMRYYLSTLHWLDAVDSPLADSIDELKGRVQAILDYEKTQGPGSEATLPSPKAEAHAAPAQPEPRKKASAKRRLPLIAAVTAMVLACVIGFATFGKNKGDSPAAGASSQEAAKEQAATDDTGTSPEATKAEDEQKVEQPSPVAPAAGDEGAAEIYLYTVQSDNTIRLDRYFGPESTKMVLPTTIEGLPVTKVGEKCFEDCEYIEELVLPETMEIIQYRAFAGCKNLKTVNIPASLKKILGWAFAHTALTSVTFPDTFQDLDYGVFYGCTNLESVVLSPSVDYLGENTFRMCGKLRSVTIPAAEVEINAKAFEANTEVTIIGVAGSYTEKYAKGMGLEFQAI